MYIKNILTISTLLATSSFASSHDNFSNFLNETNLLASSQHLGIDYSPSVMTILREDDLRHSGARNLLDALRLSPGIDVHINSAGHTSIIIRGIGKETGIGKTKILLNGMSQNNVITSEFLFNLPIGLIDRIEIIRGSASLLYGNNAFSGLINIVTIKDKNKAFTTFTKHDDGGFDTGIGFVSSYKKNNLDFSLAGSFENKEGIENIDFDTLGNSGKIDTSHKELNLLSQLSYKDFSLNLAYLHTKRGEFYGRFDQIIPEDSKYNNIFTTINVEASKKVELNNNLTVNFTAGYFSYDEEMILNVLPATAPFNAIANTLFSVENLFLKSEAEFLYKKHKLLFAAEASKDLVDKNEVIRNYSLPSFTESALYNTKVPLETREKVSLYFEDTLDISEKFALTFGLRYEYYNDVDSIVLPRISTVYEYNENNIFKAQYSKGFRAPTLLELQSNLSSILGNSELDSEVAHTYEISYIYKKNDLRFQSTLYHSNFDNIIVNPGVKIPHKNIDNASSNGIEFEYNYYIGAFLQLSGALSFIKTDDICECMSLRNHAETLGNFRITHNPYSNFSSSLQYNHIGSKKRKSGDPRSDFKSFNSLGIIFNYKVSDDIRADFGVNNIFNKAYKTAADTSFPQDYTMSLRSIWASMEVSF